MEKGYYKNLAEKYFAGDITEAEISELAGWIRNNAQLAGWWEKEFEKSAADISPALRDKMFAKIKTEILPELPRSPGFPTKTRLPHIHRNNLP